MTATADADQVGAATRDARTVIEQVMADPMVSEMFTRHDAEPGPFARELLDGIRRADERRRLRSCRHLSGRGPAPAWIFGWRPGRLYCHVCATVELAMTRTSSEGTVCDVCRRPFPKLWAVIGAAGPFLVSFGACRSCFAAETGRVTR
ncbi:MAG: hypothetical protein ABI807_05555 [Sporichthyaceae bacterium]